MNSYHPFCLYQSFSYLSNESFIISNLTNLGMKENVIAIIAIATIAATVVLVAGVVAAVIIVGVAISDVIVAIIVMAVVLNTYQNRIIKVSERVIATIINAILICVVIFMTTILLGE